ncbi:MAG: histidinol dehydrogenase [Candidatus Heimdallarchaeota archaeon]|nr:histidinol dehydrogenase [Candidatus Heimdallarchaeota archaeon]
MFKENILSELRQRGKNDLRAIIPKVDEILTTVKLKGDQALLTYTKKFDAIDLTLDELCVHQSEIAAAYQKVTNKQLAALKLAAKNITQFHKKQKQKRWRASFGEGITVGQVIRPLTSVGVYAPGGTAVYPSSILMCAIPAKVAGVKEIIVCTPPQEKEKLNPLLLVAADISGVTAIYRVGGAQAIAAMAYGTKTIPKVDKITGPGNIFVTTAKILVNRETAIDLPAGPSEILVIADGSANPRYLASDLLAQAEHDPNASAILLITSKEIASKVMVEINKQLLTLDRKAIIKDSLEAQGFIVLVESLEEAVELSNMIAPEHLSIQIKNPAKILDQITNAGAIFLGEYSPVAFGDYTSGLNHVLPTAGFARTYSGLTTRDFYKTINFIQCNTTGFQQLRSPTEILAQMEGLDGHARSVSIRSEGENI